MSLQEKTIFRYKQCYPNDTLKEISLRTGIQITRVFRLFNGKKMKVMELEAMENAINQKVKSDPHFNRLQEVLEIASTLLTNNELAKIVELIERKNTTKAFSRSYLSTNYEKSNIA
jgi:hypothetical protein